MKAVWVRARPGNLGRVILRRVYDDKSGRGQLRVSLQPEQPAPHVLIAPAPPQPDTTASSAVVQAIE